MSTPPERLVPRVTQDGLQAAVVAVAPGAAPAVVRAVVPAVGQRVVDHTAIQQENIPMITVVPQADIVVDVTINL
jgi:hypothetical protein